MRITESRLRKIIRSVIKESMSAGHITPNLEDVIQSCREGSLEDPSINDNDIQNKIMDYTLDNYKDELDLANEDVGSGHLQYSYDTGSPEYREALTMSRHEGDYDAVIMGMSEDQIEEMCNAVKESMRNIRSY